MTKFKTRYDPPDMYQALDAAEGLTDDEAEQAEIAASLLGATVEEAAAAIQERAEAARARPAAAKEDPYSSHASADAFDSMPDAPGHPLDNRPPQGRRNRGSSPEVVVVRKSRPRAATVLSDTRPGVTRKPGIGGKLRLNLT